jgi:ADP-dependent NAD(P)H-hydrate dehydratase / NAD(P)H-hydrate epimerase
MKILTAAQLKEADVYTIKAKGITSIVLMEEAAHQCVVWLIARYTNETTITIFCGTGNNGGDGLAIARLLKEKNYSVQVFVVRESERSSEDFKINEERLKGRLLLTEIKNSEDIKKIKLTNKLETQNPKPFIVIDCLFGTGLNKPATGLHAETIEYLNSLKAPIILIDIPSGLFAEEGKKDSSAVIKAAYTLTFHSPKLAFMFPENEEYVGEFSVLDIGFDKDYTANADTNNYFVVADLARSILKKRTKFSHKGSYGHALLICGSYGKIGAAVLASQACLRAGAGLVTSHIPSCGYEIIQSSVPEAMADVDESEKFVTSIKSIEKYNAIGIGPGIGTEKETQGMLKLLIQNSQIPLVMDADALNILSENKTWLAFLPKRTMLTPHVKEFERLFGESANGYERYILQKEASMKYGIYILLKGAHSSVSCPDGKVFFNSTGNPGMATGGTGDVLTGIVTGLFAQGYNAIDSLVLGAYLHGLSADIATVNVSEESLIASDIISNLGLAFNYLRKGP